MTAIAQEQAFDPADPLHVPDPHPLFHRMREQAPVYRQVAPNSGRVFWFLTRYADVQRALLDPGIGRQLDRLPEELAAPHRRWENDALAMVRRNVFNLDPPDHTRLRRLITPAFGARAVAELERSVGRVVGDLADGMAATAAAGGEPDVIEALALPLPILVVADLFGFPAEDRALFRRWSDEMVAGRNGLETRRSGMKFVAYITRKIAERRDRPGGDLLSQLAEAEAAGGITRYELISSVFQLLFAGDETTVNLIGIGVLELLRHPGQLARLRAHPELIGPAVEEVLRYNGPVGHSRPLFALDDVDFGDAVVPRGDIIVPVLLAAGRDPAVFPRPDLFDIARSPNRHLGFGHGIHFCLGAALARVQARAAIGTLVRRFPDMNLAADPATLEWTDDLFLRGPRRLPLRLLG
ncbi:cytochrome P450 hydroxylase [Sphaerisporangium melleum]|uniref:Cytochrome P450 hydroxylase n=1 Tax=Sphaerisporangium melleum TaxID=321316 RepID=A0A917VRI4_9ACTN|nr:cytochrome P450 [Sphaerisporangium melleum]GGL07140.1 cytochrome P450 hydroxylase [Sphaerisporangium melleum]GII68725.1 cytochrome P450 hydroxylase [Sphaerisporangium melleum]